MVNEELKGKLLQAYRVLFMEGLAEDTTRGHVTARSDDGAIYIKPWGVGFEEVEADDFLGVDAEGNLQEGNGELHSEIKMHLEIYRRRPDVFCITHLHPFHAVVLSSVFREKIHIVSQQGLHFGGGIPFYESAELIHTKEQAGRLVETLADKPVILMRNHGIVTAGRTIEEATIMAIDFEKAAKEHLTVSLYGEPFKMDDGTVERMNAKVFSPRQYGMLWGYYCRKVLRMKG